MSILPPVNQAYPTPLSTAYPGQPTIPPAPLQQPMSPSSNLLGGLIQAQNPHVPESPKNAPRVFTIMRGQPSFQWPPIMQALHALDPQAFEAILNQAGQVSVSIPKRPPEHIIHAIESISVKTQETFISTWLSQFIKQGKLPIITPEDRAKFPQINFDQSLKEIEQYANGQIQLVAPGADVALLSRLNQAITPLRKELMASNIEFESYNERAKNAKGIFYAVAGSSLVGYAIEYVPFLKPLDRFREMILSQLDDYGNWAGEIASVKGQGYSWNQVISSQWLAIPAIAWTFLSDLTFREKAPVLDKTGVIKKRFGKPLYEGVKMNRWQSRVLRGMKFGVAGGVLSIAASVSTLLLMFHQHKKLIRESKTSLSPFAQSKGLVSQWNSFKEAFKQDIQYPARVGLFLGSGLAVAFAGLAALIKMPAVKSKKGQFLLSMVLIQALVGVGETIGATIASLTGRKRNERHLNQIMNRYSSFQPTLAQPLSKSGI